MRGNIPMSLKNNKNVKSFLSFEHGYQRHVKTTQPTLPATRLRNAVEINNKIQNLKKEQLHLNKLKPFLNSNSFKILYNNFSNQIKNEKNEQERLLHYNYKNYLK